MNIPRQLEFQRWALGQFHTLLKDVTEDQGKEQFTQTGRTIHSIYTHMVEVTWFWLEVIKESKDLEPPVFEELSLGKLMARHGEYLDELDSLMTSHLDQNYVLDHPWLPPKAPTSFENMAFNILNHLTYHRGQLAVGLARLGFEIPETDYNPYHFNVILRRSEDG